MCVCVCCVCVCVCVCVYLYDKNPCTKKKKKKNPCNSSPPPKKEGDCPQYTLLMSSLPLLSSYKNTPFAQPLRIPFCLLRYCLIQKLLNKANEVFKFTQLNFCLTACSISFPEEDTKAYYFHTFYYRSLSMVLEFI